jgi:hypothetical protein
LKLGLQKLCVADFVRTHLILSPILTGACYGWDKQRVNYLKGTFGSGKLAARHWRLRLPIRFRIYEGLV